MAKNLVSTYEKGFDKFFEGLFTEVAQAVSEIAQDVAAVATTSKAPVDTGNLRANIDPETRFKVDRIKGLVEKNVIAATDYAFDQHESTNYNHPKGGQAKYLTSTLTEKADIYAKRVADAVERALEKAKQK